MAENIRGGIVAYNEGRWDQLRAAIAPDAVMRTFPGWPEPGPWIGPDAIIDQFRILRAAFDSDELTIQGDPREVGDRVVVRARWEATGRGPALRMELTFIYTFRDGLVSMMEFFRDHDEALAAIGLDS